MGTQGVNLDLFIRRLSSEGRVLVLGGLAVIAHGFSRTTKDADVWLEPFASSQDWADHLLKVCRDFPQATRGAFGARLKNCGLAEAERLFSRYTDHVVASAAMDNPDPAVKGLGRQLLKELARDGNPFAKDLLQGRGISPD